uniref:Killer cell lectin-like receptor 2 n=1 Tax=Peromyscus maniculatus bairdii TaxID=230844 RepID=A0A8C8VV57_PERMB
MSDEEVTYTTVRFHKSSGLQNGGRSDETQGPREAGHGKCLVPWHLIAIPLGVLCSILLVTVAVLVTHIFQYSQEKHELQKTLNNLHQEYSTTQNESYLREEMLRNKSKQYDALKDHLDSLNRKENRCHEENNLVPDCLQRTGKRVEGHWFCCGIKCYYFIMDNIHWNECEQTCRDCSLSLLKIDDDDELKFLQLQIKPNTYWIGLSYDTRTKKWQWSDGGPSKLDLNTAKFDHKTGRCAFLSRARLDNDICDQFYPCICEKRLDNFADSYRSKS